MDGDGTFERVAAGPAASAPFAAGAHRVAVRAVDDLGLVATAYAHVQRSRLGGGAPPRPRRRRAGRPIAARHARGAAAGAPRARSARRLRRRGVIVDADPLRGRAGWWSSCATAAGRRLARTTARRAAGVVALRVRARRAQPGRLRLRIVAIDLAGNRRDDPAPV